MSKETLSKEKKLTDQQLLRLVLAYQGDLAAILFKMNINSNARDAAGEMHTSVQRLLKEIGSA